MPLTSMTTSMAGMLGLPARCRAKSARVWPDLSIKELLTLLPLAVLTIYLGVYPQAVLTIVEPALQRILRLGSSARDADEGRVAAGHSDAPFGED